MICIWFWILTIPKNYSKILVCGWLTLIAMFQLKCPLEGTMRSHRKSSKNFFERKGIPYRYTHPPCPQHILLSVLFIENSGMIRVGKKKGSMFIEYQTAWPWSSWTLCHIGFYPISIVSPDTNTKGAVVVVVVVVGCVCVCMWLTLLLGSPLKLAPLLSQFSSNS